MSWRHNTGPWVAAALVAAVAFVAAAAGFAEGAKARPCPTRLDDGRTLRAQDLAGKTCHYAPAPRNQMDWYSPTELRRLARQREIQEKIK